MIDYKQKFIDDDRKTQENKQRIIDFVKATRETKNNDLVDKAYMVSQSIGNYNYTHNMQCAREAMSHDSCYGGIKVIGVNNTSSSMSRSGTTYGITPFNW